MEQRHLTHIQNSGFGFELYTLLAQQKTAWIFISPPNWENRAALATVNVLPLSAMITTLKPSEISGIRAGIAPW
jgi:hypothetical protein